MSVMVSAYYVSGFLLFSTLIVALNLSSNRKEGTHFITLHCQVKSDFGSDEDYQGLAPHRERDEYHNIPDNNSQVDSKSSHSYRISELEASESVQVSAIKVVLSAY